MIDDLYEGRITTLASNPTSLALAVQRADVLVGAVLVPGRSAPRLVTREMLPTMKPGSVIVDVAVDQGGCVETTRPTTHSDPVFVVDDVVHYCVANMPGAVPRTSTFALSNVTLPFCRRLAGRGFAAAVAADPGLAAGVNTYDGHLVSAAVAESQGHESRPLESLLS